jgi:electron transfer flavoprotein alpha subunit
MRGLRIAVLVKQVPRFEAMRLGDDGRLVRDGIELEMNPYCRRAVTTGVALAAETGGTCTVYTLGPPCADDVLREAVAWGADRGVLVTDPAFAGSDTLATAKALGSALERNGWFDLALVGRNSVDADTGQVGPQIAELLDVGFIGGARILALDGERLRARVELDDGWADVEADLPCIVSCAERLCEPCKVEPERRATVPAQRIRSLGVADLGPGPWGAEASPTRVGRVRMLEHVRERVVLSGSLAEQVDRAVEILRRRGALPGVAGAGDVPRASRRVPPVRDGAPTAAWIVVVAEPERPRVTRELLGRAAEIAVELPGRVAVIVPATAVDEIELSRWGADEVVLVGSGGEVAEDLAAAVGGWCAEHRPWALLAPSTMWGRELAGRLSVRLDAGLTGDAVELEVVDGRLVAWKPAFGGQLVAAITSVSTVQLVTVRPGVLDLLDPREAGAPTVTTLDMDVKGRVRVLDGARDDDADELGVAPAVVAVGAGVAPERYRELDDLLAALGATLAATRKVTDKAWMPRSRQVGITGHSIRPDLYVAIAVSGKFNHVVGVRAAGTVLAINSDPAAPVFDACDVGIVGDWTEVVPLLTRAVARSRLAAGLR